MYLSFQNELLENMIAATLKLLNSIQTHQFHLQNITRQWTHSLVVVSPLWICPAGPACPHRHHKWTRVAIKYSVSPGQAGAPAMGQLDIIRIKSTKLRIIFQLLSFRLEPLLFHAQICFITFLKPLQGRFSHWL